MLSSTSQLSFTPARRSDGSVDIEACKELAGKIASEYAAKEDPITAKIHEAAIGVLETTPYQNLLHISTKALSRLALLSMSILPSDKACKDAEVRLGHSFSGQPDKFLILTKGPKKGINILSRLSEGDIALLKSE